MHPPGAPTTRIKNKIIPVSFDLTLDLTRCIFVTDESRVFHLGPPPIRVQAPVFYLERKMIHVEKNVPCRFSKTTTAFGGWWGYATAIESGITYGPVWRNFPRVTMPLTAAEREENERTFAAQREAQVSANLTDMNIPAELHEVYRSLSGQAKTVFLKARSRSAAAWREILREVATRESNSGRSAREILSRI